jgi:hypothetical protein
MWEGLVDIARRRGPIPEGHFRVVTIEPDNRPGGGDFDSLERARRYADDAASEAEEVAPIAVVLDRDFQVVHEGRPYYLR